jgi:hypothetical protein
MTPREVKRWAAIAVSLRAIGAALESVAAGNIVMAEFRMKLVDESLRDLSDRLTADRAAMPETDR